MGLKLPQKTVSIRWATVTNLLLNTEQQFSTYSERLTNLVADSFIVDIVMASCSLDEFDSHTFILTESLPDSNSSNLHGWLWTFPKSNSRSWPILYIGRARQQNAGNRWNDFYISMDSNGCESELTIIIWCHKYLEFISTPKAATSGLLKLSEIIRSLCIECHSYTKLILQSWSVSCWATDFL